MKNPKPISSDLNLKNLISTRRTKLFAYGFLFSFIGCTAFLAFNPSNNSSSPWFHNLFSSPSTSSLKASIAPYRSQVSSLFSHFFPNSSSSSARNRIDRGRGSWFNGGLMENRSRDGFGPQGFDAGGIGVLGRNQTASSIGSKANEISSTSNGVSSKTQKESKANSVELGKNQTVSSNGSKGSGVSEQKRGKNQSESGTLEKNQTAADRIPVKSNGVSEKTQKESKANSTETEKKSSGEIPVKSNGVSEKTQKESKANPTNSTSSQMKNNGKKEKWIEDMIGCDLFLGHWVKDESYPLYPEGSCPHIDEPFDCYLNGRPDRSYQKLRWQPTGCNIPRLNATDMLERLRGKRLVFVGDSLNRNMWESLVCVLRNSVKDKKKVFEASGRHEFRTEGSYSFLFKDYGATVEFFRSPFLVQEWEMPSGNGTKETLRLDIIERSSSKYKDAHVIIFNTGHWWTHEKTSKGKDYYQEGNKVYSELNVVDAFHKALNTWAKWIDANVNPNKSFVFFRGYSASHFSGGQWNSGGACDKETEPIQKEEYLSSYPSKMSILESVIKGMKTQVAYLNITRMTDYRKDAHPSVYRKQNLTEEERNDPLRFQDCSHWCLPGVPDSWNELLYAQLIIKQYQMAQKVG